MSALGGVAAAAQLSLSWTDNSNNETGFKVERSLDGSSFSQIGIVGANVTTYVDNTAASGTSYWYRVRAYNAAGDSGYTNVANAVAPAANTAPTISNVSNQNINEDSVASSIPFTVGDTQTVAGSLAVTGASSNTTLVPNANIVFGGSGANRTVTVTPAANQSGSATITLTVSDGSLTATDTFVVSVTAVNDVPTITPIANLSIAAGSNTGPLAITIADVETAASSLTISATSSNQTLVPNGNVVLGGSGASRTVTVTPVGASGTATITVTVSDGTASASSAFVVTVVNNNTAPTISNIANQSATLESSVGPLNFTVGDAQTAAGNLTVAGASSNPALVPVENIVFGGEGTSRTVSVSNAFGQSGTATITVTVSDGVLTAFDQFTVTFNAHINSAPTISDIANQSATTSSSVGPIGVTVGDAQTAPGSLTLAGESSNPSLVPNGNIVFGGSGANRTVTVTKASGQTGSATITLTVSDGALTATDSFAVTFNGVSTPPPSGGGGGGGSGGGGGGGGSGPVIVNEPTITGLNGATVLQGGNMGPVGFIVGDAQSPASALTLKAVSSNQSLLPDQNIVFAGTDGIRLITATPLPEEIGAATITVTVSDGQYETSRSIVLNVKSAPSAPEIVLHPENVETFIGGEAAFVVLASGYPEPTYQWMRNGSPIADATSSTYVIGSVASSDAAYYTVEVTNNLGSVVSDEGRLIVGSGASISQHPVDATVEQNGTVKLSVQATGSNLQYQWYVGESGDTSSPIFGATSATYTTPPQSADKSYWVKVSSKSALTQSVVQSVNSETAVIKVQLPPPSPEEFDPTKTYAGASFYFGRIGGSGTFAMLTRDDKSAVFLGQISGRTIVSPPELKVSESGSFSFKTSDVGTIAGQATSAKASGTISGLFTSFDGAKADSEGPTAALAGLYDGVQVNSMDGSILVLAGPDGEAYVVSSTDGVAAGGAASLSSDGTLTANLPESRFVALELDTEELSITGNVTASGQTAQVGGRREDGPAKEKLSAISIRAQAGQGSNTLIAGFSIAGEGTKQMLIRGLGPTLLGMDVADAVADTIITLKRFDGTNFIDIGQNDNWAQAANASQVRSVSERVGAMALADSSKDAAVMADLPAGVYAAFVEGANGAEGTALVEVYDAAEADSTSKSSLSSISMRGEVGPGGKLVIAGFVVTGTAPKKYLIRSIGPELVGLGVGDALPNPGLKLYSMSNGLELVGENDNWVAANGTVSAVSQTVGAYPLEHGSSSSALVLWLKPGIYGAHAVTMDSRSGVALVEVYEVP